MSSNPAYAWAEQLERERRENPVIIEKLDDNVLAGECLSFTSAAQDMNLTVIALPAGVVIESIVPSGASAWCQTVRIDARLSDGTVHRYFQKVSRHTCVKPRAYTCFVVLKLRVYRSFRNSANA